MITRVSIDASGQEGLSPNIWGGIPLDEFMTAGNSEGLAHFDDFFTGLTFTSATAQAGNLTYQDSGVTMKGLTTSYIGELEVAGNDADNDEGSIQAPGSGVCPAVAISQTAGSLYEMAFEARVKKASIADNALAFFCGLATIGGASADILADNTGELKADHSFIGFQSLHAAGEVLQAIYQKTGETKVAVDATAATLVADTYIKLGITFDGYRTVKYFIDGVEIGSVAATATTFPVDIGMAPLFATKVGAAAESKAYMDWWAIARFRKNGGLRS
jgi:hypothetical protein